MRTCMQNVTEFLIIWKCLGEGSRDIGDGPATEAVDDRKDPPARKWKNKEDREIGTSALMSGMPACWHKTIPLYSLSTQGYKVEDGQRGQVRWSCLADKHKGERDSA